MTTATISIQAMVIERCQVTLSVFRQLIEEPIFHWQAMALPTAELIAALMENEAAVASYLRGDGTQAGGYPTPAQAAWFARREEAERAHEEQQDAAIAAHRQALTEKYTALLEAVDARCEEYAQIVEPLFGLPQLFIAV